MAVHDERQAAQRKEWGAFVPARCRSDTQTLPPTSPPGGGSGGGISAKALSAAGGAVGLLVLDGPVAEDKLAHSDRLIAIAQLGSAGREERRELSWLVRGGVPRAGDAGAGWRRWTAIVGGDRPGRQADEARLTCSLAGTALACRSWCSSCIAGYGLLLHCVRIRR